MTRLSLALGLTLVACSSGGGGGGSSAPPPPSPPPSGGWALTGSLNTARDSHTATVLTVGPNAGKVLAAGGSTASGTTLVIFNSTELYDPVAGTWTQTNPANWMNVPRRNYTATLLPNGKVLVTGGQTTSTAATATAELYDPVTGTWALTGTMTIARALHTATLLPNGTVLVAGGTATFLSATQPGPSLNTAEIYDPATEIWTATNNMVTPRQAHTSTLLQTGKVLVVGSTSPLAQQAELFDPATNAWTLTGAAINATTFSAAILLPTGKVLSAGGAQSGVTPSSLAFLYDPIAQTWTTTNSMSIPRSGPNLVPLPTGNVLIAGGATAGSTVAASAEAYVPSSGTWIASGSLGAGRSAHTTTLLPTGQVLVAGGVGATATRLASAVVFTPMLPGTADSWIAAKNMTTARQQHTANLLAFVSNAGNVLVAGGLTTGGAPTGTAEFYNPATDQWTDTGTSMVTPRSSHTATSLRYGAKAGQILVAGGLDAGGTSTDQAELYAPDSDAWTATGSLNTARTEHRAVRLASGSNIGKILVAGGVDAGATILATDELYDPVGGTWTTLASSMTTPRHSFTLMQLPTGKILAAGGVTTGSIVTEQAELFDPDTLTWSPTGALVVARSNHTATVLTFGPNGGKVLVAGGQDSAGNTLNTFELYDPIAGSWTSAGNLRQPRASFTATLLPSGRVLAAGGLTAPMAVTPTTETFNPRTSDWSFARFMDNGRAFHTATLLLQGQILVTGGVVAGAPSVLSELYSSSIP